MTTGSILKFADIATAPLVNQSPPRVNAARPNNTNNTSTQTGDVDNGRLKSVSIMKNC
jgi:hypothetical protein